MQDQSSENGSIATTDLDKAEVWTLAKYFTHCDSSSIQILGVKYHGT